MVSAQVVITENVVPALGCVIATIMFLSPMKAVLQAKREKSLDDLNPLPFVAIIANCVGWLIYGAVLRSPYVMAGNFPGCLVGIYMTLTCYGLADEKMRDLMLNVLLFFIFIILVMGFIVALAVSDQHVQAMLTGYTAVFILCCYYSAPLSVMLHVLRSKNASKLLWPSSLMNTFNGTLWFIFGLATSDPFVAYPNLVGAITGSIQLVLIFIFRNSTSKSTAASKFGTKDMTYIHAGTFYQNEEMSRLMSTPHSTPKVPL